MLWTNFLLASLGSSSPFGVFDALSGPTKLHPTSHTVCIGAENVHIVFNPDMRCVAMDQALATYTLEFVTDF